MQLTQYSEKVFIFRARAIATNTISKMVPEPHSDEQAALEAASQQLEGKIDKQKTHPKGSLPMPE